MAICSFLCWETSSQALYCVLFDDVEDVPLQIVGMQLG